MKRQGILLRDFLEQQLEALRSRFVKAAESGLALDVLGYHTTGLSTTQLRSPDEVSRDYRHQTTVLAKLMQQCKDLYLLVDPAENSVDEETRGPDCRMTRWPL